MLDLSPEVKRGAAMQLISNPLWAALIKKRQADAVAQWRATDPSQTQEREDAYQLDRALSMIIRMVEDAAKPPRNTEELS